MGSSQSSLDRAYKEQAAQLKCGMQLEKKLGTLEGLVKIHRDMQAEDKGLKAKLVSAKADLKKLATQAKLQT